MWQEQTILALHVNHTGPLIYMQMIACLLPFLSIYDLYFGIMEKRKLTGDNKSLRYKLFYPFGKNCSHRIWHEAAVEKPLWDLTFFKIMPFSSADFYQHAQHIHHFFQCGNP